MAMPERMLVGDVGGTNTRLALVEDGRPGQVARYANDAFPSFSSLLATYTAEHAPGEMSLCRIAIAGPVTRSQARLTNRDWRFRPKEIAIALPGGQADVRLVNDLVALGHALPALREDQCAILRHPARIGGAVAAENGQALVAGLGTGFNVCQVLNVVGGPFVLGAELGHTSLPTVLRQSLEVSLGGDASAFETTEHLFSGRGLERLYALLSDGAVATARDIVGHASVWPAAMQAMTLSAQLLGMLTRQLMFQYLPLGGIHFAGSVARGLLLSDARQSFLKAVSADGPFSDLVAQGPLYLITDDGAALTGLARMP